MKKKFLLHIISIHVTTAHPEEPNLIMITTIDHMDLSIHNRFQTLKRMETLDVQTENTPATVAERTVQNHYIKLKQAHSSFLHLGIFHPNKTN